MPATPSLSAAYRAMPSPDKPLLPGRSIPCLMPPIAGDGGSVYRGIAAEVREPPIAIASPAVQQIQARVVPREFPQPQANECRCEGREPDRDYARVHGRLRSLRAASSAALIWRTA